YYTVSTCAPQRDLYPLRTLAYFSSFFFNDPAPTEIYTLSLHDALPIFPLSAGLSMWLPEAIATRRSAWSTATLQRSPMLATTIRSEEHTSELQSRSDLVCRLLLEKKKKN